MLSIRHGYHAALANVVAGPGTSSFLSPSCDCRFWRYSCSPGMHRSTADMAASVICALHALWRLLYCVQLNFQLKATGPTVTKFFMVMTGYMHWMGCLWYLLSELVIRFDVIDDDPTIEVALAEGSFAATLLARRLLPAPTP